MGTAERCSWGGVMTRHNCDPFTLAPPPFPESPAPLFPGAERGAPRAWMAPARPP